MKNKLISIFLIFLSACASYDYQPNIEFLGEYRDSQDIEQKADQMKWAEAGNVKVYVGEFPKEIEISNNQLKSTSDKFKVIGKVTAKIRPEGFLSLKGRYPEDQNWRNTYCYVQKPLFWLTLTIWGYLPVFWPCYEYETQSISDINLRKMRLINTLKKITKASGGNLLLITALGKSKTTNVDINESIYGDMFSAEGYAVKEIKVGN